MIGTLAIRHELLRSLAKKVAITAVSVLFLANILAYKMAESGNHSQPPGSALWLGQIVFLLAGLLPLLLAPAGKRCRPWEMGLPLPASILLRSHFLSLVVAGFIQILVIFGLLQLAQLGMRQLDNLVMMPSGWIAPLLVPASVCVVVTAGILAGWQPQVVHLADDARWTVFRILLACGVPAVLFLLARAGTGFTLILLPLILFWLVRKHGLLPAALDWAPARPTCAGAEAGQESSASWHPTAPSSRVVSVVILKTLFKWPLGWFALLPFAFLVGMILGGSSILQTSTEMRFLFHFLIVYMLFAFTGNFLEKLHLVDHLPVRRRTLLLWLVLPGVLSVALGYGFGAVFPKEESGQEVFAFQNDPRDYGFKVPIDAWDVVTAEQPPQVVAPWGESHAPETAAILEAGPIQWRLSKPFSTPPGASLDFVAWQISRAVAEVHAQDLPYQEIAARYLDTDASGRVIVRESGLTLAADNPQWETGSKGPMFPLLYGPILATYFLVLAFCFRFIGPGVTLRKTRVVCWTTMMGLLLIHLGLWFGLLIGRADGWAFSGFFMVLIRDLGQKGPAAWPLAYLVMALLVGLTWRLASRQFHAVEPPRP